MKSGPDAKIYPVVKLATMVNCLVEEGIAASDVLRGTHLSETDLRSSAVRVSANQIIQSYSNAIRLSPDPHIAFKIGLRFHVSTYGMYGFAILSSVNFRQTMSFAVEYHELAAPLADISFGEEGGRASWTIAPKPHPMVDAALYRFITELQTGVHIALHRDVMGRSFSPAELQFTFGRPRGAQKDAEVFGCPVNYGQSENKLVFDAAWLDGRPDMGNEVTFAEVSRLCSRLLDELRLSGGSAGRVREVLAGNLAQDTSFESVARRLNMSARTLRRKLQQEGTSFRELIDDLRTRMAVKYVRDTDLTIENIAYALGFNDAAAFRHAFRRWTNSAPLEFRRARIDMSRRRPRTDVRPRAVR